MSLTKTLRRSSHLRLLALAVGFLFIVVQTLALNHTASHGFHAHKQKHFGFHECPVYEYCDQLVLTDGPQAITLALPVFPPVEVPTLTPLFNLIEPIISASPRGPPLL